MIIPALSTFLLLIYYRISDEFKDYETDKKFFPDRPIPSGRLFLSDLKYMLITVSIAGLALNIIFPQAIYEYIAAFLFTVAMGKWFFMEKIISKNRMLAFFTHAPVGLFLYWYNIMWLLNFENVQWSVQAKLCLIGFIVLPGLTWEILRKTYLPQDEMPGYQIYSTMLGFTGSLVFASLWIVLTILNNSLLIMLFEPLRGLGLPLLLINVGLLIAVISHAIKPKLKNLKPIAEVYMGLHLLLPMAVLIYRYWSTRV
jgi:4-hydroxybenzoate polyprenyltransferase